MPGLWDAIASIFSGGNDTGGTAYPTSPTSSPGVAGGWFDWGKPGATSGGFDPGPEAGGVGDVPGSASTGGIPTDRYRTAGGFNPALIPALATGASGLMGLFRGGGSDKALKQLEKSTGPMQAAGNEALSSYRSGQLTPSQQATVDQFKKAELAKWRQYLASAGIPESSAMADIEAKVNMDAGVKAQQMLQQDFENAFQATGLARSNLTEIARQQALQDEMQRKEWAEFMQSMGELGTKVDWGSIF